MGQMMGDAQVEPGAARLEKGCFDVHLVVSDIAGALRFWRDTVGFPVDEVVTLPGGTMQYRLRVGKSLIKLIVPGTEAQHSEFFERTGYRGITIPLQNFSQVVDTCQRAGYRVILPIQPSHVHPNTGKQICLLQDPEGNFVEFESPVDIDRP